MEMTMVWPRVRVATGTAYPTYTFQGDWDPLDRGVVEAALRQCVPATVESPIYNTWKLLCLSGRFVAWRVLWDTKSFHARDAGELACHLLDHYDKGNGKPDLCPACQASLTVNGNGRCACCYRILVREAA